VTVEAVGQIVSGWSKQFVAAEEIAHKAGRGAWCTIPGAGHVGPVILEQDGAAVCCSTVTALLLGLDGGAVVAPSVAAAAVVATPEGPSIADFIYDRTGSNNSQLSSIASSHRFSVVWVVRHQHVFQDERRAINHLERDISKEEGRGENRASVSDCFCLRCDINAYYALGGTELYGFPVQNLSWAFNKTSNDFHLISTINITIGEIELRQVT